MTEPQLDERKARILRAVVEEYVASAQPVASQTIARGGELGVSSATVRNDMTILEREGYLVQPHTSAGRVPTDRGYRYFVDHLMDSGSLAPGQRRAISDFFASAHGALEDMLRETSGLLTRLTSHAAVITAPEPDLAHVRSVQLVDLAPRQILAVVVLSNGGIEKAIVGIDADIDPAVISEVSHALDERWRSATLSGLPLPELTGRRAFDALASSVRDAVEKAADPDLYVGGRSRLAADTTAFSTLETTARLLELLERQVVVVSLVRALIDEGVSVRIGSEHEVEDLRDCSIVVAPYEIEGRTAGTVGVLGPTRMDYQQALAAVAAVSQRLGRMLSP